MYSKFEPTFWNFSCHITQNCFEPQKNCFQIPNSYLNIKPFSLIMTLPTNITEPPMGHTKKESLLESKEKKHHISLELIKHVFKTVMGLFDDNK